MNLRTTSRAAAALAATLLTAGLLSSTGGASAAPQEQTVAARRLPVVQEYVALGDSWTADVVLLSRHGVPDTTYAPIDCAQSQQNYPKIIAEALAVPSFADASCGSATTDDFANPQTGLPLGGTNPPQFDRLTADTDLVTVGIGGNDAGIASSGLDCLNVVPVDNPISDSGPGLPFGGCKAKYTAGGKDQLAQQIRQSRPKLVRAFQAIHRISPQARILAIDYMNVVPDHGCYPTVPASDEDMAYISAKFRQLDTMIKQAARRGGAEYVSTYRRTPEGVDMCADPNVRWAEVYGASANDPGMGVPAHPNAAGARGQAAMILEYLRETDPDIYR